MGQKGVGMKCGGRKGEEGAREKLMFEMKDKGVYVTEEWVVR